MKTDFLKLSELPDNVILLSPACGSLFGWLPENEALVRGVCFAHPSSYIGIASFQGASGHFKEGGIEVTFDIFEARDFSRELLRANPLYFEIIAVSSDSCLISTYEGDKFRALIPAVISRSLVVRYIAWAKSEMTKLLAHPVLESKRHRSPSLNPRLESLIRALANVTIAERIVEGNFSSLPISDSSIAELAMLPEISYSDLGNVLGDLTKRITTLERDSRLRKMPRDPDRNAIEGTLMETLMDFLHRTVPQRTVQAEPESGTTYPKNLAPEDDQGTGYPSPSSDQTGTDAAKR